MKTSTKNVGKSTSFLILCLVHQGPTTPPLPATFRTTSVWFFLPTREPPTLLSFWRNRGFSLSFSKVLISNESSRDQKKSTLFRQLYMCMRTSGLFLDFLQEGRRGDRGKENKKRRWCLRERRVEKGKQEVAWRKRGKWAHEQKKGASHSNLRGEWNGESFHDQWKVKSGSRQAENWRLCSRLIAGTGSSSSLHPISSPLLCNFAVPTHPNLLWLAWTNRILANMRHAETWQVLVSVALLAPVLDHCYGNILGLACW